jgi:hypothetical protein
VFGIAAATVPESSPPPGVLSAAGVHEIHLQQHTRRHGRKTATGSPDKPSCTCGEGVCEYRLFPDVATGRGAIVEVTENFVHLCIECVALDSLLPRQYGRVI